ncbi:MAG: hypothetical protein KME28_25450 [Pelatocladus maniniholoensis HA4357-MV3]|uniref:Uncharacterized protein n=1 Tax=Pelatocladus maniniholoensis HA4357-MV3 TaxID=1117104 RepID=A0A9E3HD18_9NOST|nr:hypothetical protein [Pelatocladus maniniholoensis HA4357-MV3]BAZ66713.1 hypothetical protein NIES4106_14650 [Fischerella sp. NIES-4106]
MRHDLKDLEISLSELQYLTNLPVNDELVIILNPIKKTLQNFIVQAKGPEGATTIFIGITISFVSYLAFDVLVKSFMSKPFMPSWLSFIVFVSLGAAMTQLILYLIWKQKNRVVKTNITPSLQMLLMDVDKYNSVIKAIDINDQIEAVGNVGVTIKERSKVIEALQLTKSDLIRALKTERILRENRHFIISNSELFMNNLAALTAMQVPEQASEHGRLLNEALQIALDVQHEMKRLQNQH